MRFPLVRDLDADGIPVAVTCRALGFSKQTFYAWQRSPVSDRDWADAHLINAAVDIHHDDPAFGYRFIADELAGLGIGAGENRVQRLCSQQRIWSVFAKKRGCSRKPGPPVHDDLVQRMFSADRPDQLWLTDITEPPTAEGKLYLCAIKDACSGRIVGYSMDSRMKASLAVSALWNAISLRSPAGTVIIHSDRGSQFRAHAYVRLLRVSGLTGSMGRAGPAATTRPWNRPSPCSRRTSWPATAGKPATSCAWPSSPGSSAPTTGAAASGALASSHLSNTRCSTPRPHSRPDPPTRRVNQSRGSPWVLSCTL
jgi:putative transposase